MPVGPRVVLHLAVQPTACGDPKVRVAGGERESIVCAVGLHRCACDVCGKQWCGDSSLPWA